MKNILLLILVGVSSVCWGKIRVIKEGETCNGKVSKLAKYKGALDGKGSILHIEHRCKEADDSEQSEEKALMVPASKGKLTEYNDLCRKYALTADSTQNCESIANDWSESDQLNALDKLKIVGLNIKECKSRDRVERAKCNLHRVEFAHIAKNRDLYSDCRTWGAMDGGPIWTECTYGGGKYSPLARKVRFNAITLADAKSALAGSILDQNPGTFSRVNGTKEGVK